MKKFGLLLLIFLWQFSFFAFAELFSQARVHNGIIQKDGKVIISGYALQDLKQKILLVRYTDKGDYDSSFGSNGIVLTEINGAAIANDIALTNNEKIIIVGKTFLQESSSRIAIVQYTAEGILDNSFNGGGIRLETIGGSSEAFAVQIQKDNKILVAGVTNTQGETKGVLLRYNPNGSLDTTFGDLGIVIFHLGVHSVIYSIALQKDEKIVVGGYASTNARQIMLARYTQNGTLDTTFGNQGTVISNLYSYSQANTIALDKKDMIIVGGSIENNFAILRYNSEGILDTTFGENGAARTRVDGSAQITSLLIEDSENIIVSGFFNGNFALARYTGAGILDTTFAHEGKDITQSYAIATDILLKKDGKIVVVGFNHKDFIVNKYTKDGILESEVESQTLTENNESIPLIIVDQKPQGTDGGTFLSNDWRTRDLTIMQITSSQVTLKTNQITLQPGSYSLFIMAPAYKVGNHQLRLQNVTDGITQAWGTSSFAVIAGGISFSTIDCVIMIDKITTFEVQHQCSRTEANDGFGIANNFGPEIYTTIRITKII